MLAIFVAISAFAQTEVRVQAPNMVALNEQFNVSFVIEGEKSPSEFNWEPGEDFQLVWGPQKGSSTSISIINGKHTKSSSVTYTYILLPVKTGKFQLNAATIVIGSETITSRRASIEVVSDGANASASQPQQNNSPAESGQTQTRISETGDMFIKLSLSKSRVVVGEPLTATLKFYHRANIAGFEDAHFPTFDGFWSQETKAPTNLEFQRENVNDKIYNAALLRSWTIIPQRSGDLKIEPAELVCLVNIRTSRPSTGSIFDSFFQDDIQTVRKTLSTQAQTVKVSALPANAPESFGGGVGKFKMGVKLTRDSLKAHDAASLIVMVTGSGNISMLEAPKINFPPDFEVYDVKAEDVAGGKTFEYPFIPRSYGDFELPGVEYSYYDISTGKYVTLTSGAIKLKVMKGAQTADNSGTMIMAPAGKGVKNIGSDIRYISQNGLSLAPKKVFFVATPLFVILAVLLFLIAVATYLIMIKTAERRADVVGTKNRGAAKMARKRLSKAETFLRQGLYSAFFDELHKALLGFVSDKLNMDISDMNKDNIRARLTEASVPEQISEEYIGLLEVCESARYSPEFGQEATETYYDTSINVVSSMEQYMKNRRKSHLAAIVALLLLFPSFGALASAPADSLWKAGCDAYASGKWESALSSWNDLLSEGQESPELYYNLGNASFRTGDLAHAIINYERALKMDSSFEDARYNLEYANSLTQDRIEVIPEFFAKMWLRKIRDSFSSNVWAWLSLVAFAGVLAFLLIFLLSRTTSTRKIGFFSSLAFLIVASICVSSSIWQNIDRNDKSYAVVVSPVAPVRSSPGSESSTNLFVLHEGVKIKIIEEAGTWCAIELSDGRKGWAEKISLEII